MKTAVRLLLVGAILGALVGVAPAQAQVVLRAGNVEVADHSASKGLVKMAELVAQKTKGQVKIEVFHGSTLGSEREMIESVKAGSLDMMLSMSGVGRFVQGVLVFEMPYLYTDLDHLARVWAGSAADVQKLISPAGFYTLTSFFQGPRAVASKRPFQSLEEMKGLRLRVPESPLYVGMARALGANPTPTAFGEVYTSLQTGVVDAAECPLENIWGTKWYEPAKNIVLTDHIMHLYLMIMNQAKFQKLTPEQRTAMQEAAKETSQYQLGLAKESNKTSLEKMKAAGATIIPIKDRTPFARVMESFDKSFAEKTGPDAVKLFAKIKSIK